MEWEERESYKDEERRKEKVWELDKIKEKERLILLD